MPRGCAISIGRRGCSVWPGGPLVRGAPGGWEFWLDGGHNPAAGGVLVPRRGGDRPLHLVVGMLNTKDAAGFLIPLAATRAPSTR